MLASFAARGLFGRSARGISIAANALKKGQHIRVKEKYCEVPDDSRSRSGWTRHGAPLEVKRVG